MVFGFPGQAQKIYLSDNVLVDRFTTGLHHHLYFVSVGKCVLSSNLAFLGRIFSTLGFKGMTEKGCERGSSLIAFA